MEDVKQITLEYVKTDKDGKEEIITIKPLYRVPSMKLQDEMFKLRTLNMQEAEKFESGYKDMKLDQLDDELKSKVAIERQEKWADVMNKYNIEYFKTVILKKQLTTEQKELINQDYKSDFWQEQNITEIQEVVSSFRGIFNI